MQKDPIPARLQDAEFALRTLAAGRLPTLGTSRSGASALDELEQALALDDDLLRAAHLLRSAANGDHVGLTEEARRQTGLLADFIADLRR